jgi:hypothetical protein
MKRHVHASSRCSTAVPTEYELSGRAKVSRLGLLGVVWKPQSTARLPLLSSVVSPVFQVDIITEVRAVPIHSKNELYKDYSGSLACGIREARGGNEDYLVS